MHGTFIKASEASKVLGVDRRTLKCWAEKGYIQHIRPGGKAHRLYNVSSVALTAEQTAPDLPKVKAIYARVSTRKQLPDLKNQIQALKEKYPDHEVFSDVGSGLNFKRKGLLSILQLAFARRLQLVRIAYKDRLCRFAYDLVEHILEKHGAKIFVEANHLHAPEQELAEDVVAIITVFGARLYGSRSGIARKKKAENKKESSRADVSFDEHRERGSDSDGTEAEDALQASSSFERDSEDVQDSDVSDSETSS
jgi:putative resolvase